MSNINQPIAWKHLRNVLLLFSPLWVGCAILFSAAGVGYSRVSRDYWSASQPMVLRDETTGAVERLGRFGSQTELKAAQETILEIARNYEVVTAALKAIGPPPGNPSGTWPSVAVVEGTARKHVNVRAPRGGEFGGSDMFYLQVQQDSPERAQQFCDALFDSLAEQMRQVRQVRGDSLIAELNHAKALAQERLKTAADNMREIEMNFGSDLGELRNLTEAINGEGANRRALEDAGKELQIAELELEKLISLRDFLTRGLSDPNHLLVSGADLLTRQPSLQRLKDGLIDAQLARSKLSGTMRPDHPKIKTAETAEIAIIQAIKEEIASVLESMQPMIKIETERVERLSAKRDNLETRLERLAEIRTVYSRYVSEVKHRTTLLEQAERALTDAEASRSAAVSTNLLVRLGPVTVSDHPVGPSTKMLAAGGGTAGVLIGLGIVFLVAPGPKQPSFGRRWSDRLRNGRATDAIPHEVALQGGTPRVERPFVERPFVERSGVDRRRDARTAREG
jgi:succinoglycan biosynthesis transport protein ExoP